MNPHMFAKVVLASKREKSLPLITIHARYPRIIHGEIMTHRVFCISGDAVLDFDLPASHAAQKRRVHRMTIREFADKWHYGAASGSSSRHNGKFLENLDAETLYNAEEITKLLSHKSRTNINGACKNGKVYGAKKVKGKWTATGAAWQEWRLATGYRRFDLKSRLTSMKIRQVDEKSMAIRSSTVSDCIFSGMKRVYRVEAGDFSTSATEDHRIFTENGWKRLGDIIVGVDKIATYKYGTGANDNPNRYNKIGGKWVQTWVRQIRDIVFGRQDGKCAISGDRLEAGYHIHHIEPRHLRPDLAFDIENVIAINPEEHHKIHEVQGWQIGVPLSVEFSIVTSVVDEGETDTYDLEIAGEFPNFFADGIVVHNSRNARSSRAVPVSKMLEEVRNTPFVPWHWGKNQKGMQAGDECNERVDIGRNLRLNHSCLAEREEAWLNARTYAADMAEAYMKAGYAKQIANRLLEPFSWIDTLITSTSWANFFHLRDHADAEPHFHDLAGLVREAIAGAEYQTLKPGEWHLPYVSKEEQTDIWLDDFGGNQGNDPQAEKKCWALLRKLSVARCARISYAPFDGNASIEAELKRYDGLVGSSPLHASPTEHQATPDFFSPTGFLSPHLSGNLGPGWVQHRKLLAGEYIKDAV